MVRVRCVVSVLLLLCALPLVAQTGRTSPPRDLHWVGTHWTAYNPPDPATFPPGSRVHIIQRGDTLWDLARRYYGNPYLWPQLWELNTYIRDAHWIYPGDPLLIQGEVATGTLPMEAELEPFFPDTDVPATAQLGTPGIGSPVALGTEADVYCFGYLGGLDEPMPNYVHGFEDVELKWVVGAKRQDTGVAEGDIIYIRGGYDTGLVPGDTYLVVHPGAVVTHPASREIIGRHYDFRGQVRILCINDGEATALITQSCSDIRIGDRVRPLPLLPIPLARQTAMANVCTPPTGKVAGLIVNAQDYTFNLGVGSLVHINLGREDFVEPGDFLTVYRPNPAPGAPRQILGEIGILTAEDRTATARIMRMRYSMQVGDLVELK
jgi:hypothetical protein